MAFTVEHQPEPLSNWRWPPDICSPPHPAIVTLPAVCTAGHVVGHVGPITQVVDSSRLTERTWCAGENGQGELVTWRPDVGGVVAVVAVGVVEGAEVGAVGDVADAAVDFRSSCH
jgi:hypothetical protein